MRNEAYGDEIKEMIARLHDMEEWIEVVGLSCGEEVVEHLEEAMYLLSTEADR